MGSTFLNVFCKISATQNTGIDTPNSDSPMLKWSASEFFFTAEMTPTGMPMIQENSAEETASLSV